MKWIALFSQTGSEIVQISERLHRYPDVIVTNNQDLDSVNQDIFGKTQVRFLPEKPHEGDYNGCLSTNALVTMHGWLRILPPDICDAYKIYNGHPGLITKYPELKGKDPQKKAVELGLDTSGCVIHEATSEVDGGNIAADIEVSIKGLTEDETINVLHDTSVDLWIRFLKEHFKRYK